MACGMYLNIYNLSIIIGEHSHYNLSIIIGEHSHCDNLPD